MLEDSKSIYPSSFDIQKINDMQVGEYVHAECGAWVLFCYKNHYCLMFHRSQKGVNAVSNDFDNLSKFYAFMRQIDNEN